MPKAAKRPCRYPGCPNLCDKGVYCEKHVQFSSDRIHHLILNGDRPFIEIDVAPSQAKALIDAQTAVSSEEICQLKVCTREVFVKFFKLISLENMNLCVFVKLHFRHVDLRQFVLTEHVVLVAAEIPTAEGLTKYQVEHFQKGLDILKRVSFVVVEVDQIILYFLDLDALQQTESEFLLDVLLPQSVLLAACSVGSI